MVEVTFGAEVKIFFVFGSDGDKLITFRLACEYYPGHGAGTDGWFGQPISPPAPAHVRILKAEYMEKNPRDGSKQWVHVDAGLRRFLEYEGVFDELEEEAKMQVEEQAYDGE